MFEIPRGSEAFTHLARIIADPDTHKVTVAAKVIGTYGEGEEVVEVALKRNEGMWTAPLSTEVK